MKKKCYFILSVMFLLMLTACGFEKQVDSNTVMIDKKGKVTEAIIEDFDQPYYNADELKNQISEEINNYNAQAGGEKISIEKFKETEEKTVIVYLEFASFTDYSAFNDKELFAGTVSDAYNAGYEFPEMTDVESNASVTSSQVMEKGDLHIAIYEEAQQIRVPGDILYLSGGVSLIDSKTAMNQTDGELVYVIYK